MYGRPRQPRIKRDWAEDRLTRKRDSDPVVSLWVRIGHSDVERPRDRWRTEQIRLNWLPVEGSGNDVSPRCQEWLRIKEACGTNDSKKRNEQRKAFDDALHGVFILGLSSKWWHPLPGAPVRLRVKGSNHGSISDSRRGSGLLPTPSMRRQSTES
jgi:hypothetical protein